MGDLCKKIFRKQFLPRRIALLRAFTEELHLLVEKCDPAGPPVCLYASSRSGKWKVKDPQEYLPTTRPEHYIGVNKRMLEMSLIEWIRFAAKWSDAWLISYAFFRGACLNAQQRNTLFGNINNLSTLVEEIERYHASEGIPQHVENLYNMRKIRAIGKSENNPIVAGGETSRGIRRDVESGEPNENHIAVEDNAPNENHIARQENPPVPETDETYCGKCNRLYQPGQFWILCDASCNTWFHGRCVRVSKKQSEEIALYKCPQCRVKERSERSRKRKRDQ